jgi:two-component system, LytTR family, response regulator
VTVAAPLRAFLIDDEPLALKRLARMLESTGRVQVVGRATDPERGLAQVAAQPVDVIFLDIHMPGLTGFEVLERLPRGPLVVFVTAYDQHAVQAFELNAVDYLLKPVERTRLDRTLDRVTSRRDEPGGGDWRQTLERLAQHLRGGGFLDHVASRTGDRVQLVAVAEVTHVFARERGTYAVAGGREHLLDVTLADLERRLDPAQFLRIHRATLVNVRWVGELHSDVGGRLRLRLKDEPRTDLVVSRDRVRAVKERLGLV